MITNDYDFLFSYIENMKGLFNILDQDVLQANENARVDALISKIEGKAPFADMTEEQIETYFDNTLFTIIKEVSLTENKVFNDIIQAFNHLLSLWSNSALKYNMKLPSTGRVLTFNDYYNNYIIALQNLEIAKLNQNRK